MLRQLRALFRIESPLPAYLHYHVDDEGRQVICDESRCRPAKSDLPDASLLPYLMRH